MENYRILINRHLSKLKLKFSSETRMTIIKIRTTTIKITINNNSKEVNKEKVNKEDKRVILLNLLNKIVRKKKEDKKKNNLLLLLRLWDKS